MGNSQVIVKFFLLLHKLLPFLLQPSEIFSAASFELALACIITYLLKTVLF